MQFSVVGLPHYTIWHLYEPSVDDIRHMEVRVVKQHSLASESNLLQEMEQERIARENEEKERAERAKRIKEQFADPNVQWEKDKSDIQNIAKSEKSKGQSPPEEEDDD